MTAVPSDSVGSKGTVKIMANIFISFIGAGILGLPFAFMEVCPCSRLLSNIGLNELEVYATKVSRKR